MIDQVNSFLIWFFTEIPGVGPNLAFLLFSALIGFASFLIFQQYAKHHRPLMDALTKRLKVLDATFNKEGQDEYVAFAGSFGEIDAAMRDGGPEVHSLKRAWLEYCETLIDPNEVPIRNSVRPEAFFLHLTDGARSLSWWANIFVALGLVITFLGIVAALAASVQALGADADPQKMRGALITLLTVTSAKFWTSVGGVFGSILLRYADRKWKVELRTALETLSDRLEFGMQYLPPQRLAVLQLAEAKEQTTATKMLATELAVAIRENFTTAIAPMNESLGRIYSSMEEFKTGGFNQIGKELGAALSKNTGKEMQDLAQSLSDMTHKLSQISPSLAGTGAEANRQIAVAAQEFSSAASQIGDVFRQLHQETEAAAGRMRTQTEELSSQATTQLQTLSQNINTSFEQLGGKIAELGTILTSKANEAAERNAEVLQRAATVMEAASTRSAETMGAAINETLQQAADRSAEVVSTALASFGARFDEASAQLVQVLGTTATRIENLAANIERSSQAAGEHSTQMTRAGQEAQSMAVVLGRAANDLHVATSPIREAANSINVSLDAARKFIEEHSKAAESNRDSVTQISNKLSETADAAAKAWSEYRGRFEAVDQALAEALEKIASASSEHAGHLNSHVGRIDVALGTAVDKLNASLTPLTEMAQSVEDVLGRLRQTA